jgi:hypothetical protein
MSGTHYSCMGSEEHHLQNVRFISHLVASDKTAFPSRIASLD